jgi:hypothetical protein
MTSSAELRKPGFDLSAWNDEDAVFGQLREQAIARFPGIPF